MWSSVRWWTCDYQLSKTQFCLPATKYWAAFMLILQWVKCVSHLFFLNRQSTQSRTAADAVNVIEAIVLFAPSSRIYLQTVRSSFPYCIWVIIFSVFLLYWCCLLFFPARPYLFMPFPLSANSTNAWVCAGEREANCVFTYSCYLNEMTSHFRRCPSSPSVPPDFHSKHSTPTNYLPLERF